MNYKNTSSKYLQFRGFNNFEIAVAFGFIGVLGL